MCSQKCLTSTFELSARPFGTILIFFALTFQSANMSQHNARNTVLGCTNTRDLFFLTKNKLPAGLHHTEVRTGDSSTHCLDQNTDNQYPNIQISKYPDIHISRYPDIQIPYSGPWSGAQLPRTFKCLDFYPPGCSSRIEARGQELDCRRLEAVVIGATGARRLNASA